MKFEVLLRAIQVDPQFTVDSRMFAAISVKRLIRSYERFPEAGLNNSIPNI